MGKYDFETVIERKGTICSKWDGMEPIFGTGDILPMWIADMDFKAPPEVIEALRERVDHGIFGYTKRLPSYHDAIAGWFQRRHGWTIDTEWIRHTPGVVPALAAAVLAFTQPGDGVLVQPPVYYPFFAAITGRGRRIVENPLIFLNGRFEMDFGDLEKKLEDSSAFSRSELGYRANPNVFSCHIISWRLPGIYGRAYYDRACQMHSYGNSLERSCRRRH